MRIIIGFICFLLTFPLLGQIRSGEDSTSKSSVIVDNSDFSRFKRVGNEYYQYHYGNVQMRQDSVYFRADTAIKQRNYFIAWGNVSLQQGDSLSVFGDSLNYSGDSLMAYIHQNVSLVDRERKLFTDYFIYDLNRKVGWYETGGLLTDKEAQLYSKKGRYEVRSDLMFFKDSVRVTHPEFLLKADSLAYNMKKDSVLFRGPTLMTFDSTRIYSERGYYDIPSQIGHLNKNAQYKRGDEELTGKRIIYDGNTERTYIINNAVFRDSLRYAEGDTIIYDARIKKTWLIGNATDPAYYKDQTTEAIGKVLIFNNETGEVFSSGRSSITLNEQILIADTSSFSENQGDGYAKGGVIWQDTSQGMILYTPEFEYKKVRQRVVTKAGRPLFVFYNEGADSLFLSADTIISFIDTMSIVQDSSTALDSFRYFQAYNEVRIWSKDMSGICDSLVYSEKDSLFTMYKDPVLWSERSQISADTIYLQMENGKLSYMDAKENSFMIEQVYGEYFNQVNSRTMQAQFSDGKLQEVWAIGNAMTFYYILDDEDAFIGLEEALCSELKATFDSTSKLSQIAFYQQVEGEVLPIEGIDPKQKRFEGFKWEFNKKPKSREQLFYDESLEQYLLRKNDGVVQDEKDHSLSE